MKRTLIALAVLTLLLPIARNATAADVSIDFFYNNLGGGQWIEVGDYGYGWQPDVAVSDQSWRPYADGYWAYTDLGWTWISYEDFGWATYHYGRWARLTDYGWVWFPGEDLDWGPAWVSWRHGSGVVGWAPLPPRGPGIVYRGEALVGPSVDIEFDIGPAYYNFVDVRYIGEPVLRQRIYAPTENITYVNQTVNVTNITVQNNVVYNYGPDYNALSAQSSRPIQKLALERQTNVDPATAVKSGAATKVQGNKLVVAAPMKIQKPATQVAPPKVAKKVAQPKVEKGWTGVANAEQIKQKIKTENPKQVPPPTRASGAAASGAAAQASPAASAAATASASTTTSGGAAATTTSPSPAGRGKGKGKAAERAQAGASAAPAATESAAMTSPSPADATGKRGRGRGAEPLAASPAASAAGAATSPAGKQKAFERNRPNEPQNEPGGGRPGKRKGEVQRATPGAAEGRPGAQPEGAGPGKGFGAPPSATPYGGGVGQNLEERRARGAEHAGGAAGAGASPAQTGPSAERSPALGEKGTGFEREQNVGRGTTAARPEQSPTPAGSGMQRPERGPAAQRGPATERPERGPAAQRGPGMERPERGAAAGGPPNRPEGGKKHGAPSPTPSPR